MWKQKFILYNQEIRKQITGINRKSGISWKLLKVIRLGVFDINTKVMSNSKMFAWALKEEAEEKCIWPAFRALVLHLGCTSELLGKKLKITRYSDFISIWYSLGTGFFKALQVIPMCGRDEAVIYGIKQRDCSITGIGC